MVLLKGNTPVAMPCIKTEQVQHISSYFRFGIYWEGNRPVVFVKDVDLIKKIQVGDFDYFTDLGFNTPDYLEKVGNVFGIADMQGEQWRKMKRMVTPPFSVPRLKKTRK